MCYGRSRSVTTQSQANYLMASDANGCIIQSFLGFSSGSGGQYLHRAMAVNHIYAMALHVDPKGRLLYEQDRYLGMFDPYDSVTNYITGTVAVTNGSTAVVGTGTTFDAGMVGKAFRVIGTNGGNKFYRISAYTDATHITLSSAFTGTTSSGNSFVINVAFDDQWKDFGADISASGGTAPMTPIDNYEDTVLFGRNNKITTLNVTTDTVTTDASPAFELPTGYDIDHIVTNSNGILIGANIRGRGVLVLWDNFSDRSIAPWIWFDDNIYSICKWGSDWIVITSRQIIKTNGYSIEVLASNFLNTLSSRLMDKYPKNSIVIDNVLHFGGLLGTNGLRRAVLYRFDLTTKLFEATTRADMNQGTISFKSMEYSSESYRLFIGVTNGVGLTNNGVEWFSQTVGAKCGFYISPVVGKGVNKKIVRGVRVRVKKSSFGTTGAVSIGTNSFSFDIALKISTMKRDIFLVGAGLKADSANKHTLAVDNVGGQFVTPQIGDEVQFNGDSGSGSSNNAGYARNITSISGAGTTNEVWTVDSDFPDTPKQNQIAVVTPFKLVDRKTITTTGGDIEEIYFDVKNRYRSRNFMLKLDIENNTVGVALEILPIEFVYEDEGAITT